MKREYTTLPFTEYSTTAYDTITEAATTNYLKGRSRNRMIFSGVSLG